MDYRKLAKKCANFAVEKKGKKVVILDMRKLTTITDYFVITSGHSAQHLKTISRQIYEKLKEDGIYPFHREGVGPAQWVLLDYKGVIVHIFQESARKFYNLEKLWIDAKKVSLAAKRKTKKQSSTR